jgi:hypothetical protein
LLDRAHMGVILAQQIGEQTLIVEVEFKGIFADLL